MALIKCSECSAEISDKAAACIKCGAPIASAQLAAPPKTSGKPKPKTRPWAWMAIAALVALFTIGRCASPPTTNKDATSTGTTPPAKAAAVDKPECASTDLQCRGDKGYIAASIYCKSAVESLASHSMRWTDGTFETKFSRFRWTTKAGGALTYIGNKAEFQNGFGAYTPVIYECDLANDNKTVVDVRAREGRLTN